MRAPVLLPLCSAGLAGLILPWSSSLGTRASGSLSVELQGPHHHFQRGGVREKGRLWTPYLPAVTGWSHQDLRLDSLPFPGNFQTRKGKKESQQSGADMTSPAAATTLLLLLLPAAPLIEPALPHHLEARGGCPLTTEPGDTRPGLRQESPDRQSAAALPGVGVGVCPVCPSDSPHSLQGCWEDTGRGGATSTAGRSSEEGRDKDVTTTMFLFCFIILCFIDDDDVD